MNAFGIESLIASKEFTASLAAAKALVVLMARWSEKVLMSIEKGSVVEGKTTAAAVGGPRC
jgi:hypothetical protein